jgi:hypothetical protein
MRCAVGSSVSQASSAGIGPGSVMKKLTAGVCSSRIALRSKAARLDQVGDAEDRSELGMVVHQAVEDVHVAIDQTGLLRRDHEVGAGDRLSCARDQVNGHDLVEFGIRAHARLRRSFRSRLDGGAR